MIMVVPMPTAAQTPERGQIPSHARSHLGLLAHHGDIIGRKALLYFGLAGMTLMLALMGLSFQFGAPQWAQRC